MYNLIISFLAILVSLLLVKLILSFEVWITTVRNHREISKIQSDTNKLINKVIRPSFKDQCTKAISIRPTNISYFNNIIDNMKKHLLNFKTLDEVNSIMSSFPALNMALKETSYSPLPNECTLIEISLLYSHQINDRTE